MNSNDFKIIFNQDSHEVDVEVLIACLMRTSNIIQAVNRKLNTDKKIEVKIKALEKGSFEIHIELVEKILKTLFAKDNVTYGASIVAITTGLYGFSRFLRGKKPNKIKQGNEVTEVTNAFNEKIVIQNNVFNFYNESKDIRENINKQFSAIDKNEDIKGVSFIGSSENITIDKEDFKNLSTLIEGATEQNKEPIIEVKEDTNILIIRPSFTKRIEVGFYF